MQHRPSGARASAGRPQDPYGLPLTTTPEAADAYNQGLRRFLGVRSGAADEIRRSVATDPDFALGHAALALLGHAGAAEVDIPDALGAAVRAAVHRRPDERERSFLVAVAEQIGGPVDGPVGGRVNGCSRAAAPQLLRHIRDFPRDALCVNIAVPTISSNGVTQGEQAWSLIESLDLVYGEDPWYLGQLAFVRQEQSRWQEAETLACRALDADPGAGHAVHARAHVLYETGEHLAGLDWLEGWLGRHGAGAFQSAHFSWHAALYELMLDDLRAVRDRYRTQLAPPQVTGARALIDSGSLLWRCHVTDRWEGRLPAAAVVDTTPEGWLDRPPTAFAALHAALLLAASADGDGLSRLRRSCLAHAEPDVSPTLAGLCQALMAVVEHRWDRAARLLQPLLPRLEPLGGSAAQRDVVEETLLYALVRAGRNRQAARLLSARLDRRPAPLDRNRLDVLMQREVVRD